MSKNAFERIYKVVKSIPKGKVATYGQVALAAGNPRWARVVGYALHVNPEPNSIPCYRVVTKDGRVSPAFAFGGENMQIELLKSDGVGFKEDGYVDMEKYQVKNLISYDDMP
jgi:methylated-DNA-protein-cysteine methyltransferase-like protein